MIIKKIIEKIFWRKKIQNEILKELKLLNTNFEKIINCIDRAGGTGEYRIKTM
jgi:hypothetical protein